MVLLRKQESMVFIMFGFFSNIFSILLIFGYFIYKDIRGFILFKFDMYNKIMECFSFVLYYQIIFVFIVLGYCLIQCGSIKLISREVLMMVEF